MMEINGSDRLRFGAYEADLHTHELWKHGTRIKLVGQPFEILAVLVKRPGQLVTREELRAELWPGDTFVDFNHGLNAAVNKLRDALCDSADDPKYIETLPRRGYRFIAEVEQAVSPRIAELATAENPGRPASTAQALLPKTVTLNGDVAEVAGVEAVSAFEPSQLPSKSLPWLRYTVLAVGLILGLWRLVDLLGWNAAKNTKLIAENTAESDTLTPLTALSDRTGEPAFSPDGIHVAFRREGFVPGTSGIWVKQIGGEELTQVTNNTNDGNPVWSPDGRSLAFSRLSYKERTICEVPASGGEVQSLFETSLVPGHAEIDWSPDGKTIAFAARGRQGFLPAIFLLSLADHSARQITAPSSVDGDWGPSFSPDSNQIVFVRSGNIVVMPVEGGEIQRVTQEPMRILGSPVWTTDGRSIIFAVQSHGDLGGLWRIPISGGLPVPIHGLEKGVLNPAVSRRGFRLAFELFSSARSIDQIDLYPTGQSARTLVTTVSGENAGQQLSPDGKKLVFQSDRTGGLDIWVSDRNGQNPIQLTAMGTAATPRWSPDGKQIVFDVGLARDWREARAIFLVDADGGTPRPLVQDNFSNNVPSWSHDGDWIYFASNRSGAA